MPRFIQREIDWIKSGPTREVRIARWILMGSIPFGIAMLVLATITAY
ncbi:hypothetical protein C882_4368 [Caenispirillum salinarum AK4]|uniref:Uncharacterized protein n=1 Tax=Caenispirillum salinarum AK4 TaxID=1238182 RepID=K9H038_9PROT|nr:hypothetical protein [Caenispirillum salinarum]EKV30409.1 hypothetical protein C882_4368 [Caenispirillum salinarum AK4]